MIYKILYLCKKSIYLILYKMKTHFLLLFVFALLLISQLSLSQNVGISESLITPDASSILEVRSINKGVLLPRVSLTGATDVVTISSPANSLLIYNTATAGTSPNNVTPGYYYWNSTSAKWLRMGVGTAESVAWLMLGNAGTNPTSNFLGTTDAQALVFRTNNSEKMRITSGGFIGIDDDAPWAKLTVSNGRLVVQNEAGYSGSGTSLYKNNPWLYLWSQETTLAQYQGGNIIFAAMENSSLAADICMIEGVRENGTTNNTASRLVFYTRPAADYMMDRLIIDSNGDFTFKPDNGANKSIVFNDLGIGTSTEPTIVPSTHFYGFLGTDTRAWWRGYANSFVSLSSKKYKTNISSLTDQERTDMYQSFLNLDVMSYNPIREQTDTMNNVVGQEIMPKTFGLIAEDAPRLIVDETGNGIQLYEYISLLTIALQESNKRIDELEAIIKQYELDVNTNKTENK